MKHFVIYTALRIVLFAAVYGVLAVAAWLLGAGSGTWIWILVGAAVISSLLSLRFLAPQRDRFTQSVQERAARATARFEEIKSKEDAD